MNYKNGEAVLPPKLLQMLQEYVDGELIYIPKKDKRRIGWGENCGTRKIIMNRNHEIYELYKKGMSIPELAAKYYLSEDSIRKITRMVKAADNKLE